MPKVMAVCLCLFFACTVAMGQAEEPVLHYRGVQHAADGKLATDLTLAKGDVFTAAIAFPEAQKLGLKKTWACWVFPEDTWAIGGNSEIALSVDKRGGHSLRRRARRVEGPDPVPRGAHHPSGPRRDPVLQGHPEKRRRTRRVHPRVVDPVAGDAVRDKRALV